MIHGAKRSFAELLLTDIETAEGLLDVARTMRKSERRKRLHDMAVRAYSSITKHMDADNLTPEDKARISDRLQRLRDRLEARDEIGATSK